MTASADAEPDRHWAVWRWIELRGAGFGIQRLLDVATPDCARAARRLLDAEERAANARHELREALRAAFAAHRPTIRRWSHLAGKGRLAELAELVAAQPEVAPDVPARLTAARTAAAALDADASGYARAFDRAARRIATVLHEVSGDPQFREAVAWQNPRALHTAVDALHRATTDPGRRRRAAYRQWEALVTSYLQRYCAKNDTIGFFGPVGWAEIIEQDAPIEIRPGAGLVQARTVYLESWAVNALAGALTTDAVRPWAVPRRMPFVDVVDGCLHVPLTEPMPLPAGPAAVLAGCDGVRTARELAEDLVADPAYPLTDTGEVYRILDDLRRHRRIEWVLEVPPAALDPQRILRERLTAISDPVVRAPALAALDEMEAGRAAVADAAGDPDRLRAAIADLQQAFTRLTGENPVRRPGKTYAGRTLVHEECRRDLTVTLDPALLDSLWPPLSLVLESARWYTSAGAAMYRRALRDVYQERVAATGSATLRLADFWLWANDTIFRLDDRQIQLVTSALQDRWSGILGHPGGRRAQYSAEALRGPVAAAFASSRPGWHGAIQHSPDLMIVADGVDAIRAGDFRWVLGEVHTGLNTTRSALFVSQHPRPDDLHRAMAHDMGGSRVVLAATREEGGAPQRLADAFVRPEDLQVVFGHDTCGLDLRRELPVGTCLLEDVGGRLMVRSRDGRCELELVEMLNEPLMGQLVQHFHPLPPAPHTPRVTVDRLVISRETWRMTPVDLAFAFAPDERQRFLRAQAWRRAAELPRFVFVKSPIERKPFYVDTESVPSVEQFAHAVRALDRERPTGRLSVSEMLPGPDQLWLTDAAGTRYTAELRTVAVDRRGAQPWPGAR